MSSSSFNFSYTGAPQFQDGDIKKGPSHEWLTEMVAQSGLPDAASFGRVVDVVPLSSVGGLCGEILQVSFDSGRSLIYKQLISKPELVRLLGLNREAYFYQSPRFSGLPLLRDIVPCAYYAHADEPNGLRFLLLENLALGGIQLGLLCGPSNPNNWAKVQAGELSAIEQRFLPAPQDLALARVLSLTFRAAARLHAPFWGDAALLATPWLRSSNWWTHRGQPAERPEGGGRAAWLPAMSVAQEHWQAFKEKRENAEAIDDEVWPEALVALVDASFARCSFESYMAWADQAPFTLVHGDFHPANLMWVPTPEDPESLRQVRFLDWEMVGVGSGPQELGQCVVSHLAGPVRRALERQLVRDYHAELLALNESISDYTLEECWQEYIQGGLGRWIWFLAWMSTTMPAPIMKYFNKQVIEFAQDHQITVENVPLPRI